MSGVYIQGMKMPENCYQCPFGADVDIGVGVAHGCNLIKDFAQFANERHSDCPLIPVPDHGDLIDVDILSKYKQVCTDTKTGMYEEVVSMAAVRNVKRIIRADKEKL